MEGLGNDMNAQNHTKTGPAVTRRALFQSAVALDLAPVRMKRGHAKIVCFQIIRQPFRAVFGSAKNQY